ncbi:uncharacterized protein [Apostichopus japonicus]|uniref:uncharacterized protein isoform X3 n=1 Tax=Stichopus japonicus TaxID=307972 RepID=UPI003AB50345
MDVRADDEIKSVRIQRAVSGGYGFSLMGGKGTEFPPVICDILEGSPASKCEAITVGDTILKINGEPMSGQTTKQVVTALMKSPDELFLTLKDDDDVRQRLFEFLENLDQPPGFPKGSWIKKKRKIVREDYTGGENHDDVMCITEVTDKLQSKDSKEITNLETEINVDGVTDMTGPSSPHDSGYSTSVSTNGTADSITSSSSRREEGNRSKLYMDSSKKLVNDRTQDMTVEEGSVFTTTAVVHTELTQSRKPAESEDEVFYDAEASPVDGDLSRTVRQRQELRNGSLRTDNSRQEVDGQCLSSQSQPECNSEKPRDKNLPSTPPPSPTRGSRNPSGSSKVARPAFNLDAPEVSAKLKTLQVDEEEMATGLVQSPLDKRNSVEADPDESSDSTSPETSKTLDYPSAKRLANRLYMLDGFKKSDIAMHLSKLNDFNQLVAEEYFAHYTFTGERLDQSLRKFLLNVALTGESQERERVLRQFAKRYHECNGGLYQSDDAVNTLTCAIMLLNTDLHGKNNIGKKMSLNGFITNLEGLNDGGSFSKDMLKAFYQAIKAEPLKWALDKEDKSSETLPGAKSKARNGTLKLSGAPLLQMETDPNAPVYMKGYVMRKCIREADGKKPSRSKRKWKLFYGTVKGLILFLHKSEATAETNFQVPKEAISLHHSLSGKITDYKKRPHVFTLRLANWKEYLFQSTQQADMQNWMQALNMAASVHSSPPLPAAVGRQKRFSRPLLPSSSSRLSWQDQLKKHETKSMELEKELATHREMPPDQNAKGIVLKDYKLKSDYLEYELMRFKTYSYLLQAGPSSTPRRGADLTLGAEGNSNGRALSDIADGSADQPVFRAQKFYSIVEN